jgi:hypothetical protein
MSSVLAVRPTSTMSQAIPVCRAALAIDRTYHAVDSSSVATTTASLGGQPCAARMLAAWEASSRIERANRVPSMISVMSSAAFVLWS